jgi:hypothetical protein
VRCALAAAAVVTAAGVVIVLACGGQVYGNPLGYLDDGGVFHSPDGAIVFGPGSACVGYDRAAFDSILPAISCSTDDDCNQWLHAHVPTGYAYDATCTQAGAVKKCNAQFIGGQPTINTGAGVYCTPGPEGDAYCTALLNQFLLGDGHSRSSCVRLCQLNSPENNPPYCEPGTDQYKCSPAQPLENCACDQTTLAKLELCVDRGDASHCEAPCTPPPDGGLSPLPDAGADQ